MKSLEDIAVIVTCYQLGRTVEEAVDSALNQTRPAREVILIDDGSTDALTRQVLARLHRPRTRVLRVPHQGVASARNQGVAASRAGYLMFLDADDAFAPTWLERAAGRLDAESSLDFVSCALEAFEGARYRWVPPAVDAVGTLTRGSVHISSLFRRRLWERTGGFDLELPAYEDLDFWLRAISAGCRGEVLDEVHLHYRVRPNSRYRQALEPERYRAAFERIVSKHPALLSAQAIEVLQAKESFLVQVLDHRDHLRSAKRALTAELEALQRELSARADPVEPSVARAELETSAWKRFLSRHRPALRGRILWVGEGPAPQTWLARWDAADAPRVERIGARGLMTLADQSADALLVFPWISTDHPTDLIRQAARVLAPGGALLLAGHAGSVEAARLERELEEAFGLEDFECSGRDGVGRLTVAARRPNGAGPPQRRQWWPRSAPGDAGPGGLVLAWHRIASLSPDPHHLCVSPPHFEQQLVFLKERCTVLSLEELAAAAEQDAVPHRAVALTFDDGYLDALEVAAPLLVKHGLPATFFVNTERLDQQHESWQDALERVLLSTDAVPERLTLEVGTSQWVLNTSTALHRRQVAAELHGRLAHGTAEERMAAITQLRAWNGGPAEPRPTHRLLDAGDIRALARLPGMTIGSHSENHLWLTECSSEVQLGELRRARDRLEQDLGIPVPGFCYPYGAVDAQLAQSARQTPYQFAVTVEPGLVSTATDPFLLPRVEVGDVGLASFEALVEAALLDLAPGPRPASDKQEAWRRNDALSRLEHARGRTTLAALPQFLIIDPTSRCNARCVMCPVSFRAPGDHGVDLPRELFDRVVPALSTALHINLFASGEPTIAPDVLALIDETALRAAPHCQIWLSTNGKVLQPDLVDRLVDRGIGIQFSVDGGTREVFESIRRGIKFEQLTRSLELVEQRRGAGRRPPLSFSCTISKRNLHDLAAIFELAVRFRVDQVLFYEEDPENAEQLPFALSADDRPIFEAQRARIDATAIPYRNGLVFRGPPNPVPSAREASPRCNAPWKVLMLRADGEVRPCCTLRESMGNLNGRTLDEVWNGERYVRLRRAFVEQRGIPAACHGCTDPLRKWGE